ncbi:MAG: hypothetical protein IJM21_07335 [Clostridia bacterium]|nr:hypothetical protein [Clostridia bacterium]
MTTFRKDRGDEKDFRITPGEPIRDPAARISCGHDPEALARGEEFAREIEEGFVADFEKSEEAFRAGRADAWDKMAHVSTFFVKDGTVYASYYANTKEPAEDPLNQTARLAFCPLSDPGKMTWLDLGSAGDVLGGRRVDMVYDTILMPKDEDTLWLLWTARAEGNYYRLFRPFSLSEKKLGETRVNRFRAGEITNDFSASGIRAALAAAGIPGKKMYSDIGVMQKLSFRMENGKKIFYTGAYSGDFNCIVRSEDLETWEYVAQPDFPNDSKWENATFVFGDRVYYFVRQQDTNPAGFLTAFDLRSGKWERPVEIDDCQSRGDFLRYKGGLYLFHAPIDREHIGIVKIDTDDLAGSREIVTAKMKTSCFYPYTDLFPDGKAGLSYTVARRHIRLARFDPERYLR